MSKWKRIVRLVGIALIAVILFYVAFLVYLFFYSGADLENLDEACWFPRDGFTLYLHDLPFREPVCNWLIEILYPNRPVGNGSDIKYPPEFKDITTYGTSSGIYECSKPIRGKVQYTKNSYSYLPVDYDEADKYCRKVAEP